MWTARAAAIVVSEERSLRRTRRSPQGAPGSGGCVEHKEAARAQHRVRRPASTPCTSPQRSCGVPRADVFAMLELEGDAVAENMARMWPAGVGRLGALLQLPALAAQAGDIGLVLVDVELP